MLSYPHIKRPVSLPPIAFAIALFAVALLIGLVLARLAEDRLRWVSALAPLVLICIGMLLSSCGGGGTDGNLGTPAGTYTLPVTGTFHSDSTALALKTNLTLVVQ
jgi:hypothetical protein